MPAIIRQALSDRIRRLPELQEFTRDFRNVTGFPVEFVGALGHRDASREVGALCQLFQQSSKGCQQCAATVQNLLTRAVSGPAQVQCDAGLLEAAVPLQAGGQTFGYFIIGGYFAVVPDVAAQNRIRHHLERFGSAPGSVLLQEACNRSRSIDPERHAALVRILALAAKHLVRSITENLSAPSEKLPPLVRDACNMARRNFRQEFSLSEIARELRVSTSHLCRAFHQSTGLRFREYVGRLRAEHARELLLTTDQSITEIAFCAGFQSISQFNRVFRSVHGTSPQTLRKNPETQDPSRTAAAPGGIRARTDRAERRDTRLSATGASTGHSPRRSAAKTTRA